MKNKEVERLREAIASAVRAVPQKHSFGQVRFHLNSAINQLDQIVRKEYRRDAVIKQENAYRNLTKEQAQKVLNTLDQMIQDELKKLDTKPKENNDTSLMSD